ncbi:MAG: hypothetical protein FWC86_04650 [Coriobacteriia bacterium]|nr:hypothetical protein [Coriobacteriia bacterium]
MKKNRPSIRPIILTLVLGLLCLAMAGSLLGCSVEEGDVGNVIDRALWDMRGYPSQQEILDHLQEKYGEDFELVSLNPGARFFQGIAFPRSNPELHFSLEMHDEDGNPAPIEDMRDDFQARLAEQYIHDKLLPLFQQQFGTAEIANLRIEVALYERTSDTRFPVDFEWLPDDGLDALAAEEEVIASASVNLMLESASSLDTVNLEQLTELIVVDAEIPLNGDLNVRAADQEPIDALHISWAVEDGQIRELNP